MKVIGFDYDGTIINIEPQKAREFGKLLHREWGVDIDEAASYWIETGGLSRRSKFDYFYRKQFGKDLRNEEYVRIESEYSRRLREDLYPGLTLLPGAVDALDFCKKNFDLLFVSSGVPTEEIRLLAALNKVDHYFDRIFGTDEKFQRKEDHFQLLVSEYMPDVLVYVGDGLEDMRVGSKFSAITIGVPTNHSADELKKADAKYVCEMTNLVELLKKLDFH